MDNANPNHGATMAKRKAGTSGGARMKAAGKSPILLGVTPEEKQLIQKAADLERRRMTEFLLFHGLAAARKIISKSSTP